MPENRLTETTPPAWLIHFADQDHGPEIFTGDGAEEAARMRFSMASDNWTCYLFKQIDGPKDAHNDR